MSFIQDLTEGGVKGFLEGIGKSVREAVAAFKADPTKVVELEVAIEKAHLQYEAAAMQVVNQTMQAESRSEHWLQWSWRPIWGLSGAAVIINNYVLLPYFSRFGIVPIAVPPEVWGTITVVVGVAAYTRGKQKEKAVAEG